MTANALPLAGVVVCDVTQNLAGPMTGRLLAELGADVVHVERLAGDNARNITTDYLGREGIFHIVANRSKTGIAVDMKDPKGTELVRRLALRSDVLVENLGPGAMDRLGLGYEALAAEHPGLVYGSLSAYGMAGRQAGLKGYDYLMQALAGLARPTADGKAREFVLGGPLADTSTPLLLSLGVCAALVRRAATGKGEHVQTSLLQGTMHMLSAHLLQVDADDVLNTTAKVPIGGDDPTTGAFHTSDGEWVAIVAFNDAQFQRLCEALGRPDVAADPGLATQLQRGRRSTEVRTAVADAVAQLTAAQLFELLEKADIPCEYVYDEPKRMMTTPSVWRDEVFATMEHPTKGTMTQAASGIAMAGEVLGPTSPAPLLGEHTRATMTWLGYDDAEVDALRDAGIVLCAGEEQGGA